MSTLWEKCLFHLRGIFSEREISQELGGVQADEKSERQVILLAPNHDAMEKVKEKFLPHISAYYHDHAVPARDVAVQVAPAAAAAAPAAGDSRYTNLLSSRFTFAHFVSGPTNALAERAALDIARSPGGDSPNPLFISGGYGLGKTHLLQAIAHHIHDQAPATKVLYVHGERFVEDAIRAMRSGNEAQLDAFKQLYRSADVLLVDDIWVLARTNKCLQEFLHTLTALFARGAQVVVAAARLPHEVDATSPHAPALKSLLRGGLHVVLNPPDAQTCVRILLHKAAERGADLPRDVAEYVAANLHGCVRGLENTLCRIHMQALHEDQPITSDLVRRTLSDHHQPTTVAMPDIIDAVCELFGCAAEDLISASRRRAVVRPRQIAMTLASDLTDMSLADIGDAFGGRDHSTVIYAQRKIRGANENDPDTWARYQNLLNTLRH